MTQNSLTTTEPTTTLSNGSLVIDLSTSDNNNNINTNKNNSNNNYNSNNNNVNNNNNNNNNNNKNITNINSNSNSNLNLNSNTNNIKSNTIPSHLRKLIIPEYKCPDCRDGGKVIEDPKSGRIVCSRCGLVIAEQYISEDSEWRTFADDDRGGADPNRVGSAQHYLMTDTNDWSTSIGGENSARLQALQQSNAGSVTQKRLAQALALIRRRCRGGSNAVSGSGLHLPIDVQNMAGELFKSISELREFKNKRFIPKVACCVYIAAKQCRCDRPLKELCQEFQTTTTDVKKVHSEIKRQQAAGRLVMPKASRTFNRESTAEIYALRYCNDLKLPYQTVGKNIQEIVKNIEKEGVLAGKQPTTIAATAVYLGSAVLTDEQLNKSYKEISQVSGIAELTIQNAFRSHVYAHRSRLLPPGYGDILKIEHLRPK